MAQHFIEIPANSSSRLNPMNLVSACMERDAHGLLVDEGCMPAEFFDLSSGIAGELIQKLTNYGIRMAAVVPQPEHYSEAFQDFAREANHSRVIRFCSNRHQAVQWLTAEV